MVKNGFIAKTKTTLVVLLSLLIVGLVSGTAFAAEAAKDNVLKEGVASFIPTMMAQLTNGRLAGFTAVFQATGIHSQCRKP